MAGHLSGGGAAPAAGVRRLELGLLTCPGRGTEPAIYRTPEPGSGSFFLRGVVPVPGPVFGDFLVMTRFHVGFAQRGWIDSQTILNSRLHSVRPAACPRCGVSCVRPGKLTLQDQSGRPCGIPVCFMIRPIEKPFQIT
jgi:hypothetical protein